MGFAFYAVEATGGDRHFDHILRIAAVRTDHELAELDRFDLVCRMSPHVVPHPGALLARGTRLETILDPTLPTHYEMTCKVVSRLEAWGPSIFVSWNGFALAEDLLRQSLFQTLHPPYLTVSDGNGRADLMKIAQAVSILAPGTLGAPDDSMGGTFALQALASANGVTREESGGAMGEVDAMLELARLMSDRAPDLFSRGMRCARRVAVDDLVADEPDELLVENYFMQPYQYAVTVIGRDAGRHNAVLAYDLRVDPAELRALDQQELGQRLGERVKPIRRFRTNAAPFLVPLDDLESFADLTREELLARAEAVRQDTELRERLCEASTSPPYQESTHVELQMNSGFSGDDDKRRMRRFHHADWAERAAIVDTFDDRRLVRLGRRLVMQHAPGLIDPPGFERMSAEVARRKLADPADGPRWMTLGAAERGARALLHGCDDATRTLVEPMLLHLAAETARCGRLAG